MRYIIAVRESTTKHPIISSIINYLDQKKEKTQIIDVRKIFKAFKLLICVKKNDKFIATDPLIGAFLIFILRKKITFFSLEMFEYQVNNTTTKKAIRNFIFKKLHYYCLTNSLKIIFPNQSRRNYYVLKFERLKNKSIVIRNFPSSLTLSKIKNIPKISIEEYLIKHGLKISEISKIKDLKIYVYPGTLSNESRGLDALIKYFNKSSDKLLILAGPDKSKELEVLKVQKNVLYIGEIARSDVIQLLKCAQYGILFYERSIKNTDYCAPVKIFEYMNCGIENIISTKNIGMKEYDNAIAQYINIDKDEIEFKNNESFNINSVDEYINISYEEKLSGQI